MSFFCTFSEIASTFPARGLAVHGNPTNDDVFIGIRETVCKQCGKKFSYTPNEHRYIRHTHKKAYKLCSYSCCRAWDREREEKNEKRIEELEKKLEYLKAQSELPPSKRDSNIVDVFDHITYVEECLSTAYTKRSKKAVDV